MSSKRFAYFQGGPCDLQKHDITKENTLPPGSINIPIRVESEVKFEGIAPSAEILMAEYTAVGGYTVWDVEYVTYRWVKTDKVASA